MLSLLWCTKHKPPIAASGFWIIAQSFVRRFIISSPLFLSLQFWTLELSERKEETGRDWVDSNPEIKIDRNIKSVGFQRHIIRSLG